MTKKVLFVLSNEHNSGDNGVKTGFNISTFITSYYALLDNDIAISIASPKGGEPPFCVNTLTSNAVALERLNNDADLKNKLAHTLQIANLKEIDFDAVLYPGGYGALLDLATDNASINLIESFYRNNKPIAFVGHACAALQFAKNTLGEPLVKDKKVSGISIEEETTIGLNFNSPFLVEDMLKENKADYSKMINGLPHAIKEGILITGQNYASTQLVLEKLLELL